MNLQDIIFWMMYIFIKVYLFIKMLMTSSFVCATLNLVRKKSTGTEPKEHFNSDPVISLFRNMQIAFHIWKMPSHAWFKQMKDIYVRATILQITSLALCFCTRRTKTETAPIHPNSLVVWVTASKKSYSMLDLKGVYIYDWRFPFQSSCAHLLSWDQILGLSCKVILVMHISS